MNDVRLEYVACALGCKEDDEAVLIGRDRLHGLPGDFSVVKCRNCCLMRTNPRPTRDSMGFYYPDNYRPYLGTRVDGATPVKASSLSRRLRPLLRWVFDTNTVPLPPLPPGHLLEIGCASGVFLHSMAGKGWSVEGIEFSTSAANAAKALGYKVHAGSLEDAPAPDGKIDLVVGWMVLEHLHDPVECLIKLHQWVKPGGWLVLSVPNAASWDFALFKHAWYALQLPNHLYHFSPTTLRKVLKAAGWETQRIFHQRVLSNYFGSLGDVLTDKGYNNAISRWLSDYPREAGRWHYGLLPISAVLSALGQTGRMTVWARRKDG